LQEPDSDIFMGVERGVANFCYKTMLKLILGTDMARHKALMDEFTVQKDPLGPRGRELALTMLLKAADISNPTKPFETSRQWAGAVIEEFYHQGDLERNTVGSVENPMMDREKSGEMATGQIGFINFVCIPFYKVIVDAWPSLRFLADALEKNKSTWQSVLNAKQTLAQQT